MNKNIYEIGDKIFSVETNTLIGIVVGVKETYWSCDKSREIVYTISTPEQRMRRINEKDIIAKNEI